MSRPSFTIAAPMPQKIHSATPPASHGELVSVPVDLPIRVSHDERTLSEKVNDRRIQDMIVHGDKWLGIGFFIGSWAYLGCRIVPDQQLGMVTDVVFVLALAAASWLTVLGVGTGILYGTNRGKGFNQIFPDDKVERSTLKAKRAASRQPQGSFTRIIGLSALFAFEATLLVLGIYLQGWWQIFLGLIGLIILGIAFIYNINAVSITNAITAELTRMAANQEVELPDPVADPYQDMPKHKVNEAKRAQRRESRKHLQLLILTVCDFGLAGSTFFACLVMSRAEPWAIAATFTAFVGTSFWLMFLGQVTGYGGPGEHDHPLDVLDDEEETESICDLMKKIKEGYGQ